MQSSEGNDNLDFQGTCFESKTEAHIHKVFKMRDNKLLKLHIVVSKES